MISRPYRFAVAWLAVCFAVSVPFQSRACSVCQCGDPLFTSTGSSSQAAGAFNFYLESQFFEKSSGVLAEDPEEPPNPGDRERSTQKDLTLYASWTPVSRITFSASLPYRWITVKEEPATERSRPARTTTTASATHRCISRRCSGRTWRRSRCPGSSCAP